MNRYVCKENMCTGCRACVDKCNKDAITIKDNLDSFNAIIDPNKCVNCNQCHLVCPNNTKVELQSQLHWYQGWAIDENDRRLSSSGGFATVLSKAFVQQGGVVCSCLFKDSDFVFDIARTVDEVEKFRGSKYVKSNPNGIYRKIKNLIKDTKVLFIGLPCQVAAVKNFIGKNYQDNLYTVDIICHGTPSVNLLKKYLNEHNINIDSINNISFRDGNKYILRVNNKHIFNSKTVDNYISTFLSSLSISDNCYSCRYATDKRVGDITIGDAWGSELLNEVDKGISLIMCQTQKGEELIKLMPFHLETIDVKKAIESNHQLMHPAKKLEEREKFFDYVHKDVKYDTIIRKLYPKTYYKQFIKRIVFKNKK